MHEVPSIPISHLLLHAPTTPSFRSLTVEIEQSELRERKRQSIAHNIYLYITPSTPPPPMSTDETKVRWGIIGTGQISHDFVTALLHVTHSTVVAVGSRTLETARLFAERHQIGRHYGSYQDLVDDPEVDIVYVATPHAQHHDNVMLALRHGKHVLCEKSFAMNEAQASEMFECARLNRLFLMEANWMVCFPLVQQLMQLLQDGVIGRVNMLQASIGWRADRDKSPALFDLELGGGSLLASGVYGVMLACLIFGGAPSSVRAVGSISQTDHIDEQCSTVLAYDEGSGRARIAVLSSSIVSPHQPTEAIIIGDKGTIRLHGLFCCPTKMTVSFATHHPEGCGEQVFEEPLPENPGPFNLPNSEGLAYEAQHVVDCVRAGLTVSPLVTPDLTLAVMRIMDTVRRQIGVDNTAGKKDEE